MLIDAVAVLGTGVVLPLALGGPTWRWAAASAALALSLALPTGASALLVAPLAVVCATALAGRLASIDRSAPLARLVVQVVAPAYALVATAALAQSRAGLELFGIGEPIVELTGVHFIYAGCAALVLAGATAERARGRWARLATAAVALTAAAPPVVAVGFVTGAALPQVGGAMLMTLGVWCTATLHLSQLRAVDDRLARTLLAVSGLAIWVPMALAVAWAAGQHWDVPALSVDDMVRTHGLANALAFTLCALVARRLLAANPAAAHPAEAQPIERLAHR